MTASAVSGSPSRAYWLKTLHQWHWISSALSLVGMLAFAVTGITLNHAGSIEAQPVVTTREAQLPAPLLARLAEVPAGQAAADLPADVRAWLVGQWRIELPAGQQAEWTPEEVYLALPRPGGDAWLRIDRAQGGAEYERTDRGWVSYFNDLHKGRHTGVAWAWFLDAFAVACVVFSVTGLLILKLHAVSRPLVWPVTALGLVVPLLLAIWFIH
jgi:hypothetical protein